jgi:hypothetical protein
LAGREEQQRLNWESLEELRQEFQIPPDIVDRDEIRAELRRQLAALHPDKTGGKFASTEQESRFLRVSEALAHLDGDLPVPVVLQGMTAKLQAIENRLAVLQSARQQGYTATMDSDAAKAVARLAAIPYRIPRIGSCAFATVCGSIIAFSKILDGNPVFGAIGSSRVAVLALLVGFVVSGALFTLTWLKERRSGELVQWLLTDDGLASVVRGCIYPRDGRKEPESSITKREMADHIAWMDHIWHRSPFVRRLKQLLFAAPVSRTIAERIAHIHLSELLARGVVRSAGLKGIEPVFGLDPERAKEIVESNAGALFRAGHF